ncbi:hypothetical protein CPC08DRAFT_769518 [Agrocybe pediades]|nr:hypothetical protein CPC08DRAFT_769518 [Agrocybe pediades]
MSVVRNQPSKIPTQGEIRSRENPATLKRNVFHTPPHNPPGIFYAAEHAIAHPLSRACLLPLLPVHHNRIRHDVQAHPLPRGGRKHLTVQTQPDPSPSRSYDNPPISGFSPYCVYQNPAGQLIFSNVASSTRSDPENLEALYG